MLKTSGNVLLLLAMICTLVLFGQIPQPALGQAGQIAIYSRQYLTYETVDDTFSDSKITGARSWSLSLRNREQNPLQKSSIEVLTQLPADSFQYMSPQPNSTSPKGNENLYTWRVDTLKPLDQLGISLGSKDAVLFTPGFDSQRNISPVIIDSKEMNQTVLVTVTAKEKLDHLNVDVQLDTKSIISASISASSINPKNGGIYTDKTGMSWTVTNPEPNQPYKFNVTLQLKNPIYPEKLLYKPRVIVSSYKDAQEKMDSKGPSLAGKDDLLGTTTYSADGQHEWSYVHDVAKRVTHKSVTGAPLVSLTIEQPQSLSVTHGVLKIVASAASSAGVIVGMDYRIGSGEWVPIELGNETEKQMFASNMMTRVGMIEWDTAKVSDGPHEITIRTQDSIGITDNKTVTIIVDNSGPRFIGYSQVINFAIVVAIVAGVVGALWIGTGKIRRAPHVSQRSF